MNADARFKVLSLATLDTRKFGIEIGTRFDTEDEQFELEAMQVEDWVRLIDLAPRIHGQIYIIIRIFHLMPNAVSWFEQEKARRTGQVH